MAASPCALDAYADSAKLERLCRVLRQYPHHLRPVLQLMGTIDLPLTRAIVESPARFSELVAYRAIYRTPILCSDILSLQGSLLAAPGKLSHFIEKTNSAFKSVDAIDVRRPIGFNVNQHLQISFHRTVRVADNGSTNNLPPSFGTFPLHDVARYPKLPAKMTKNGGYFLPMYQREAMWIRLHSSAPFAVRIYVGGVNAVSGEPARETETTLPHKSDAPPFRLLTHLRTSGIRRKLLCGASDTKLGGPCKFLAKNTYTY